jgi:DNA-binding NtrC family response regulator
MEPTLGRVLIADDEPALLKMITAYLRRLGYAVSAVPTPAQACAEMEADPSGFICAVVDATMDGMPVEELGRKLLGASAGLRLLVASGFPIDVSALETAAPGRVAFLHKPFTPEMLANTMRRLLGPKEQSV